MAFTILQNSTTADASDENENFYHIGQGSRLPMGGTSLANTDSVYDLGSATYRWNDLFCNDIDMVGSITTTNRYLWLLESEITLTATTASISFTGLNGDNAEVYRIISRVKGPPSGGGPEVFMYLNGDSNTANYGYQYLDAISTTVNALRGTTGFGFIINKLAQSTTMILSFSECIFYAKTGNERTGITKMLSEAQGTFIYRTSIWSHIWNNSASTLTSLVITTITTTTFQPGTHIEIWKRG